MKLQATYVLPIAADTSQTRSLTGYLRKLGRLIDEVIVVDGSAAPVFHVHKEAWGKSVHHISPSITTPNGKVAGVITGVAIARNEWVIIADDDVRYRQAELLRVAKLLEDYDVVRPQNVFRPLPWHARWDTPRSLFNRLTGGDWPGTLGIRKSRFITAGGYSGQVLFENFELVRTLKEAGGREVVPLDLFVERRPPSLRHFKSQRIRQAYDEWARPVRFTMQLGILPLVSISYLLGGHAALLVIAAATIFVAELGRRIGNGERAFRSASALWAPLWLAERAITSWIALATRLFLGGVRYRSGRLKHAATPRHILSSRRIAAEHTINS